MKDALIEELNRAVTLTRVGAAEIHRRARASLLLEQATREERASRSLAAAAAIVQWLAFDGVAAYLAFMASNSVLLAAIAATTVHLGGMISGAARAARV